VYEDVRWAPRLADVPGIAFTGSPGVDRTKLKHHALRPTKEYGSLSWETRNGWTSEAPAAAHRGERDIKPATLIRRTWEALELPGTAADWHYTLLDTTGQLWRLRTREPDHLAVCEQFCRIDIDLVRIRPEPFWRGETARDGFVSLPTFGILIKLLRAVDDLDEALAYARLGLQFGQGTEDDVTEIEEALGAGV
jgi:hypothetical protein